jgi:NAD+ synthetase
MLSTRALDGVSVVAFVNTVGGQDELVFDGNSRIYGPKGEILAQARAFEEDLVVADIDLESVFRARLKDPRSRIAAQREDAPEMSEVVLRPIKRRARPTLERRQVTVPNGVEEIYRALLLGTRDYVRKNDFEHVVIGLSGGIDSALTASIAADAIGAEHVTGVFMPSGITSRESEEDAAALARNFGIKLLTVPIDPEIASYRESLRQAFASKPEDVTEENIQSRIRGTILMAFSNKFGWLVLTTGNKSELSVGYATLYGDMAGGFSVLKDVSKTLVYELARHRNAAAKTPWIPERTLTREPTAELRHPEVLRVEIVVEDAEARITGGRDDGEQLSRYAKIRIHLEGLPFLLNGRVILTRAQMRIRQFFVGEWGQRVQLEGASGFRDALFPPSQMTQHVAVVKVRQWKAGIEVDSFFCLRFSRRPFPVIGSHRRHGGVSFREGVVHCQSLGRCLQSLGMNLLGPRCAGQHVE